MAGPNYSIQLVASPTGSALGLSVGNVLVFDGTTYQLSTAAIRGTRKSSGIAIASSSINSATLMQVSGDIPPTVSGLGAGTAGPVRVSTAGLLERTTAWVAGDDVCGWAEADGTVHCFFGGEASGAVIVGAADGSNIVLANPSTWGPSGAPCKSKIDTAAITAASGSAVAVASVDIPDNTSCDLVATCIARRSDNSTYRVDLFATYKRTSAGAPTLVGAAATETNKRNDAGAAYSSALVVNGNNVELRITPTATHNLTTSVLWQRQDRT